MKVGVIQSNYVPWRGYFDFIKSVDAFVIYDDVAFSKGSYRNRNQLKFAAGLRWLTVPVHVRAKDAILDVTIDTDSRWIGRHDRLLHESLEAAPYFGDAISLWRAEASVAVSHLSLLNRRLIGAICRYLGIHTPLLDSAAFKPVGTGSERLIDLLKKVGASAYVSGPAGKGYLDEDLFRRNRIALEYKTYDYAPYPQLHGAFTGNVSVLDLIANCGPEAAAHLSSRTPNQVAVA